MALEGSLRDFGLADILQLIYFQKKTGVLTLNSRKDNVRLLFSGGNVVSAESRKRIEEERAGKILLKKKLISEGDLKSCLEEQRTTGARIGDILFKKGLVDRKDIEETLVSQMTETVVQLFSWKEGTYEFQTQTVSGGKEISVTLDTQHLLMEGLRIVDEWSLVEGKVTLDTVFRKTWSERATGREEDEILKFVDGENDVAMIIDLSGANDFEASRLLLSLMERGIIEPVAVAPVAAEAPVAEAVKPKTRGAGYLPRFFSLVAVIISVVAVILQFKGMAFFGTDSLNRIKAVKDIDELRFSIQLYKYRKGSYPQSLAELGKTKDPWGRAYLYSVENENPIIMSVGPDGKAGTPDDVY